jgi:hypothetical protein
MKQLLLFLLGFILASKLSAQKGSAELMLGNRYLHYQHTLFQPLKDESRFGWQHIATVIKRYETQKGKAGFSDELMNQVYLTYALGKVVSVKAGLFYSNPVGYKPSLALQALLVHKHGSIVISPRINVVKEPDYELFLFSEYFLPISQKSRLLFRLQAMSNASRLQHNRSYQLFRVGVDLINLQLGAGFTLDEFGKNNKVYSNAGFFIRKKW